MYKNELWSSITLLGKVIGLLKKNTNDTIPRESRTIIQSIYDIHLAHGNINPEANYNLILQNIPDIGTPAKQYINTTTWKVEKKAPPAPTILQLKYLYLLEMKLLSQYVDYKLEDTSSGKPTCLDPGLLTGQS